MSITEYALAEVRGVKALLYSSTAPLYICSKFGRPSSICDPSMLHRDVLTLPQAFVVSFV